MKFLNIVLILFKPFIFFIFFASCFHLQFNSLIYSLAMESASSLNQIMYQIPRTQIWKTHCHLRTSYRQKLIYSCKEKSVFVSKFPASIKGNVNRKLRKQKTRHLNIFFSTCLTCFNIHYQIHLQNVLRLKFFFILLQYLILLTAWSNLLQFLGSRKSFGRSHSFRKKIQIFSLT